MASTTWSGWLFLLLAGIFEVMFTTTLKLSGGFSLQRPGYIVLFTAFALASFGMVNLAMRTIPLGTAYAVWTGLGVLGTTLVGILWFHDPTYWLRLFFLALLLASIVGLKLVS